MHNLLDQQWDEIAANNSEVRLCSDCRLLYDTVNEALAKELYRHYGGVVRLVLETPKVCPYKGLDELLEELHKAVAGCDTKQVGGALGQGGVHLSLTCCPCPWDAGSAPSPIHYTTS